MARGMPCRCCTSAATAAACARSGSKSGRTARARSMNRATAGLVGACSPAAPSGGPASGTGNGGKGRCCSPSRPSARRDVTSRCRPGQLANRSANSGPMSSTNCSTLSSTSSVRRPASRRCSWANGEACLASWRSASSRAASTASVAPAPPAQATSGTKATRLKGRGCLACDGPPAAAAKACATSTARRVLPWPPGPSTLTRRCACTASSRPATWASAPCRRVR